MNGSFSSGIRILHAHVQLFLRFSESDGMMDGIHNILKEAFAEHQLLLKKLIFGRKICTKY